MFFYKKRTFFILLNENFIFEKTNKHSSRISAYWFLQNKISKGFSKVVYSGSPMLLCKEYKYRTQFYKIFKFQSFVKFALSILFFLITKVNSNFTLLFFFKKLVFFKIWRFLKIKIKKKAKRRYLKYL